uniref:Helically-extended SH3 domain-containing protein n=1 Tax=Rhodnius prolixus TaxID=13249 RepID=T1HS85_RHOPR
MSAFTRRKAKTKYRDRLRLERASQEQSNGKSRKAGGAVIYRNINSFTDYNRVNIDISEIYLEMKDAKAGDVCLVNEKGQWHLQIRTRVCVYIHSGTK